ncbi:MAG: response regulator [Negativicutes bacterium]|jgi:two-component SAPR family response regulator
MLNIVLVEDEKWAMADLCQLLADIPAVAIVNAYLSPLDALANLDEDLKTADVYFLDVNMAQMSGLSFAIELQTRQAKVKLVFITGHENYALQAFDVAAFDYILKPVKFTRLYKTILRLKNFFLTEHVHKTIPAFIKIKYFGRFDILLGGQPVKWLSRKAEELVAYLLVNDGAAMHSEQIYEALWSEPANHRGLANLRTTVFRARQSLNGADGRMEIDFYNDCYRLILRDWSSDLQELEQKINNATVTRRELQKKIDEGLLNDNGWLWAYEYSAQAEERLQAVIKKLNSK